MTANLADFQQCSAIVLELGNGVLQFLGGTDSQFPVNPFSLILEFRFSARFWCRVGFFLFFIRHRWESSCHNMGETTKGQKWRETDLYFFEEFYTAYCDSYEFRPQ